MVCNRDVVES